MSKREGTGLFGWCLTPHTDHHNCPGTSVSGARCPCEHHEREEERDDDGST